MAAGFGVIGILEPGEVALDIVEQPAAAIDQQRPEEHSADRAPNQEPVTERRPSDCNPFNPSWHRLSNIVTSFEMMQHRPLLSSLRQGYGLAGRPLLATP